MHPKYDETIVNLIAWAKQETTIHGVVLLGSQVRKELAGDEWSDLDILLLADEPSAFIQNPSWLSCFGEVVCYTLDVTPLDFMQLTWTVVRVLFADNRALDFSVLPYNRLEAVLSLNAEIHIHGYQVIYDECPGLLVSKIEASLIGVKPHPGQIPTEDFVRRTVNDLLFQIIWAYKKIKRNELWHAVSCINGPISRLFLQLIETHPAVRAKTAVNITYDGRFLEQRLTPELLGYIKLCFTKYEPHDAVQTLRYLINSAEILSQAICQEYGYPFNVHQFELIRKLWDEMEKPDLLPKHSACRSIEVTGQGV